MTKDRLTRIWIEGLRVLEKVQLDLETMPMTVLIGDNGTGKSTLLEAFELLRKAGDPGSYAGRVLSDEHGPFQDLLRRGEKRVTLGVSVEGDGPRLDYSFSVSSAGTSHVVSRESLLSFGKGDDREPLSVLRRDQQKSEWFDQSKGSLDDVTEMAAPSTLLAANAARGLVKQEAFVRLAEALRGIDFHPPFDVRPLWQQEEMQMRSGPRWPARPSALERARRYGSDLPAAFTMIRNNDDKWHRLIERARAALGAELVGISLEPAGAGQLEAKLEIRGRSEKLPLRCLSDWSFFGKNQNNYSIDFPEPRRLPSLSCSMRGRLQSTGRSARPSDPLITGRTSTHTHTHKPRH